MDPILLKASLAVAARADQVLLRIYEELKLQEAANAPGPKVDFIYHTYSGVLLWATQSTHRIRAPYDVAERALNRLLRYTLKWGCFAYGALFIPLLAYGNYLVQKRSIRRQQETSGGK